MAHRRTRWPLPALLILAGIFAVSNTTLTRVDSFTHPLYAQPLTHADSAQYTTWLHVEVQTDYSWFWQKSVGRAYTTRGRDSKERVKVGKLCIELQAHDTKILCIENADSIRIEEKKKGVGIPKRTAYVAAWTESPRLDTSRVSLTP